MKNLILIGIVSLVLFALSAALSVWLQQSKTTEDTGKTDENSEKIVDPPVPEKKASNEEKVPNPDLPPTDGLKDTVALLKEREARFERRQAQIELILQDIRLERDRFEQLSKQAAAEIQAASAAVQDAIAKQPLEPPVTAPSTPTIIPATGTNPATTPNVPDAGEAKNIDQLARVYEALPADSASKILQNMADTGRMDTAVRILAKMKERNAAAVLAALPDAGLAAQLLEKIRTLQRTTGN